MHCASTSLSIIANFVRTLTLLVQTHRDAIGGVALLSKDVLKVDWHQRSSDC
jgi:hypothetical protein